MPLAFALLAALFGIGLALIALELHRLFRQRPPDKLPERPPESQKTRLAIHEAGHAVAAWSCTLVRDVTLASIKESHGGLVLYDYYGLQTREAEWCKLVIALAGIAAEAMVFSKARSLPAQNDLQAALVAAREMGEGGPPWPVPDGPSLPVADMFESRPSDAESELLRAGYLMAVHVLRAHGPAFYKVVSMLLVREKAQTSDLECVLGHRLFVRLMAGFKPRFMLPL